MSAKVLEPLFTIRAENELFVAPGSTGLFTRGVYLAKARSLHRNVLTPTGERTQ